MTDEQRAIGLAIVEASIAHFGASDQEFKKRARTTKEVNARHSAWLIMRNQFGFSTTEVGAITGHDHTTVCNGTSKARFDELRPHIKLIVRRVKESDSDDVRRYLLVGRIKKALFTRPELFDALEAVIS